MLISIEYLKSLRYIDVSNVQSGLKGQIFPRRSRVILPKLPCKISWQYLIRILSHMSYVLHSTYFNRAGKYESQRSSAHHKKENVMISFLKIKEWYKHSWQVHFSWHSARNCIHFMDITSYSYLRHTYVLLRQYINKYIN